MYTRVSEIEISYRPIRCKRPQVKDSATAASIFRGNWDEGQIEYRESVKVMLLNIKSHCMGICTVAEGGGSSCAVDVRNVLQTALIGNARGIIMCHNHPSGSTDPSHIDDDLTRRIAEGCRAVGLRLYDHIIISADEDSEHYSYNDNGKI